MAQVTGLFKTVQPVCEHPGGCGFEYGGAHGVGGGAILPGRRRRGATIRSRCSPSRLLPRAGGYLSALWCDRSRAVNQCRPELVMQVSELFSTVRGNRATPDAF